MPEAVKENSFPYIVNNCYSLGYWLKDYGYYPKEIPLFTYMDHGMTLFDHIPQHEIDNDAPLIFKFSPRLVEAYRKQAKKPVYNLMNPAIHYRKSHKITQANKPNGSIFFVGHSTPVIDDLTDWNSFIDQLKDLPSQFMPIDISLHQADMNKGLNKIFEEHGYKVHCSGNVDSNKFIENFYDNMSNYSYTLSNLIGSYTFYAVEMGIPFSLYGEEPKYFNYKDENIELGNYESYKKQEAYKKAVSLFSGLHTSIKPEQSEFVNKELGKLTTISRGKTAFLLYMSFFKYAIKHPKYFQMVRYFVPYTVRNKYKIWMKGLKNILRDLNT